MKLKEIGSVESKILKLTYCAMLIGLSMVGAMIKIQGSIAFDSMAGYFAALFLSPLSGALVAGMGHILSAMMSSFPMTLPMHIVVALEMAVIAYIFGWIYRRGNGIIACIMAVILNGPLAAFFAVYTSNFLGLEIRGWVLFNFIVIPLTVTSAANVIMAYIIYKELKKRL